MSNLGAERENIFMEKTVCELFAGVGGFRVGLEASSKDWKTVWFSQWEPKARRQWAYQCYTTHYGNINENTGKDIATVDKGSIPNHSLLVGGFPCQDYSIAVPSSHSAGLQGKKGVLWWQIQEILEKKRPPFVLLENVDRLLKSPASQRGRDFGIILACFADLGYSVEWRVINAADYGGVQRRRRTFIFAYQDNTVYGKRVCSMVTKKVIDKEGFFATAFPLEETTNIVSCTLTGDIADIYTEFKFSFDTAGYMTCRNIYTVKAEPKREPIIPLKAVLERDVPESYFIKEDTLERWKYLKGAKQIQRVSKSGYEYIYREGAVAFPDNLDLPARTILTSEPNVSRTSHVVTDIKSGRLRVLTPMECERINGFPDNWTNTGMPERMRYFCMGNALVVPLVTRMGEELNRIFSSE